MRIAVNTNFSILDQVKLEAKNPGVGVSEFLRKSNQSDPDFASTAPYPQCFTPDDVLDLNSRLRRAAQLADDRFHKETSWKDQGQHLSLMDLSQACKESSEILYAQAVKVEKTGSRRDAWTKPLAALSVGGFVTSLLPMVGTAGHIAGVATGIIAMAAAGLNEYSANADHQFAEHHRDASNADLTAAAMYKGWQKSLTEGNPPVY